MKNKIVVAALRLFLLRGYKYVSLVEVAGEAGITKGGIYHYFENKERLLQASVKHLFEHVKTHFIHLFSADKNLRETFNAILVGRAIERYVEEMTGVQCEQVSAVDEISFRLEIMQHFPHLCERFELDQREICDALEARLAQAIKAGEMRTDLEADSLATFCWAALNGQKALPGFFCEMKTRQQTYETLCSLLALK